MSITRIKSDMCLEVKQCKNLVLSNYGLDTSCTIILPPVCKGILGPITCLGAEPFDISFESVITGNILSRDGRVTKCTIPSNSCVGSITYFTNLFGEAWHVSSNVPLLFE